MPLIRLRVSSVVWRTFYKVWCGSCPLLVSADYAAYVKQDNRFNAQKSIVTETQSIVMRETGLSSFSLSVRHVRV